MPAPLNPNLWAVVLHDADGNPVGPDSPIPTKGQPGTVISGGPDTAIAASGTQPLPVAPATTRRMTIQNTGPAGSMIRVRPVGDPAGSGILLFYGGTKEYGGADGAIAAMEAQDVSSPAIGATVATQFEQD